MEVPDGASLAVYGSDSGSSLRAQSRMYSAGAGIGGGYGQAAGDITIYGGTIEATSGHGAGIGGGHGGNGGTITIVGGEITATTLWGAGIGGGDEGDGGTIAIEGGTITAASFYGAGVGGGFRGNGGTITINDGTVTAKAPSTSPQPTDMSKIGAAIGGGCGGAGGNITISGGIVTAIASEYNAAIGDGNTANTDVGLTVTISGGEVVAESCLLGFAGHRYNDRTSSVYISGGKVTVEPYFSVGFASFASVDVQISGGTVIFDKGASEASTWDSTFTITGGSINPNSAQVEAINGSTTPVYPTKVQLEGIVSPTGVSSLSIDSGGAGYDYGTNDMLTDSSGYLYLYLPEGATMSTAITGSAKYTGTVTTDTSNSASGVLILDTAAPTVQNVTILNSNGTLASNEAAPLEGKVQIAFCEEMRPYEGAVALNGNALSSGEWSGDNTVYTVPYSGLSYSTTYTVQVSGFKDYSGNTMTEADSHSFTTVTALVVDGDASGYEYKDGVLTFKAPGDYTVSMNTGVTTTTDRIVVNAGTEEDPVNITLNGVSIVRSVGGNAFELTNGATVNLLLKGNNSLIAQASMSSGLRVPNGTSVAIDAIDADGSLYAEGGMSSAAIGGGRVTSIGTITINGGKITAYAEGYGAAIGSGMDVLAASGRVEINGEKVEATSILGCGIGGGVNSLFDAIIISGGEVVAGSFGEVTAAIGNANTIDISGGEVNATFVGNADYYNGGCGIGWAGEIHISGGEVNASSTYVSTDSRSSVGIGHSGAVFINGGLVNATGKTEGIFMAGTLSIGGGTVTATADAAGTGILVYLDSPIEITGGSVNATSISLVRSDGNTDFIDIANDVGDKVYLTKVRLGGISSATRVLSLSVDLNGVAYSYGLNDVYTDDLGYLYLYLPQGARVTAARTASNSYAGVVATDATGASDGTLLW